MLKSSFFDRTLLRWVFGQFPSIRSIQRRAVKLVLPNPRSGRREYSMIYDTLNTHGGPSDYLIDLLVTLSAEFCP